jgi:ABC-2 type transport system permease protein
MKFRPWEAFLDIFCILKLRMKLVTKDIITMLVLMVSVIIFALIVRSLTASAGDVSSLPIGMIDEDNTESSRSLITELSKSETIRIITGSESKLQKLLLDEMITSIFVINDGYEEHLKSGKLKDIITMYYKEDNKSASILADIVAGEIIYPAGLYKGYHYYDQLPPSDKKLTMGQYGKYMDELIDSSSDFNFAFQFFYRNPMNSQTAEKPLSNTILYNQFIFGILGILISFIAMFILSQKVNEKENQVDVRLKISGFHVLKRDLGDLGALLIWEGLLSMVFTGLIIRQLHFTDIRLMLGIYLLMLLNALVIGAVMLLAVKVIRQMLPYQLFGSAFILFTGGLGFYHMLSGFYGVTIGHMVKFIPNNWFIRAFTDIIIYGSEGGYLKEGHRVLILMAAAVITAVIVIDLLQGLSFLKIIRKH